MTILLSRQLAEGGRPKFMIHGRYIRYIFIVRKVLKPEFSQVHLIFVFGIMVSYALVYKDLNYPRVTFSKSVLFLIVREPGGPTVQPPHPPPPHPPPRTFHYGPKMYLRVSRTQSHLFPGQPLGCTGVIALCARVPSCLQSVDDIAPVTNASFKSLVHY